MMLKDRVLLITNVEKFAGHGTTRVALAQGATVLAHDPSFEAPSARRQYETEFQGAHALAATEPATLIELALKRHGHIDALVNNDAYPALRAPLGEAITLPEVDLMGLERIPLDKQHERRRRLDAADHPGVAEPRGGGGQWQRLPVRGGEVVLVAGLNGELCYLQDHALIIGGCAGSRDSVCWEPRLAGVGRRVPLARCDSSRPGGAGWRPTGT